MKNLKWKKIRPEKLFFRARIVGTEELVYGIYTGTHENPNTINHYIDGVLESNIGKDEEFKTYIIKPETLEIVDYEL